MNLLADLPKELDAHELRQLLDIRVGGPGQQDDQQRLYLPLAGPSCRIIVGFKDSNIASIKPGPAFEVGQWDKIKEEIGSSLLGGPVKVGRDYSFSSFRVEGSWRGFRSGIQILPPPADAPRADMELAQHPFLLEFPLRETREWRITNDRRIREHRQVTLLLNVLIAGRISILPRQTEHFWAGILKPPPKWQLKWLRKLLRLKPRVEIPWDIKWVQEFFFAPIDKLVTEEHSPASREAIEQIPAEKYYEQIGNDGRGLRVPSDLDDSICSYQRLSPAQRAKFNRALFWMDLASRYWSTSGSSSFAALVSAVEALTVRGTSHRVFCPECDESRQHEVPGAAERFRAFFETYAAGQSLRPRRSEMYALRSGILHGSTLMQFDEDRAMGWDPLFRMEYELHQELWKLTQFAIRNWLRNPESEPTTSEDARMSKKEGFLAPSSVNVVAKIRVDYAPWFEIAASFNRLAMRVLPSLKPGTTNSQQLFAATLFARTLTSFQSAYILAERGLMADARTVVRAAMETAFVLAALARNAAVLEPLEMRHFYFRRKLHSVALRDPAAREIMTAEQVAAVEQDIADIDRDYPTVKDMRGDPINVASLADQAGLTSIYNAVYRAASTDAAHTSITALERHVRTDASGNIRSMVVGPEVGDLPDTIAAAMTVLSLAIEAGTELFAVQEFRDELRDLTARWQSLGLPHEFSPL